MLFWALFLREFAFWVNLLFWVIFLFLGAFLSTFLSQNPIVFYFLSTFLSKFSFLSTFFSDFSFFSTFLSTFLRLLVTQNLYEGFCEYLFCISFCDVSIKLVTKLKCLLCQLSPRCLQESVHIPIWSLQYSVRLESCILHSWPRKIAAFVR